MTTKRFGARYGKRVKDRLRAIEKTDIKGQFCPYCRKPKIRRLSLGIFECTKCKAKFTGKAYSIGKKKQTTAVKEEVQDIPEEVEEADAYEEEEPEAEELSGEDAPEVEKIPEEDEEGMIENG